MRYFAGDILSHPMLKGELFLIQDIIHTIAGGTPTPEGPPATLLCSKKGSSGITRLHTSDKSITLKWRMPENRTGENQ